jgi:nucleoside-diphosphate kinase
MNETLMNEHYHHLIGKPFFEDLKKSMMSTPVVAMALEGYDIVKRVKTLAGATNPREAFPGTIRGDYSISVRNNVIHASATSEEALIELQRFFSEEELFDYHRMNVIDYADD